MLIVYTPGVWDLLHVGHVRLLTNASKLGNKLVVGVPSDEVVEEDKGEPPVIPLEQRIEMLRALEVVDIVLPYFKLEFITHLTMVQPDVFATGQHFGNPAAQRHRDALAWAAANFCRHVSIPYTANVSTTEIKNKACTQRTCHQDGLLKVKRSY